MSIFYDLAAQLRASSERLPADIVITAIDRLTVATQLLTWVRKTSPHPMGVTHLIHAIEHLENSAHALRATQDAIETYLTSLGAATVPISEATGKVNKQFVVDDTVIDQPKPRPESPLIHWWSVRVDMLTRPDEPPGDQNISADERITDPMTLLQSIAGDVRQGERDTLRLKLRDAHPPTGLGLSAISPAALRLLTQDVLGHTAGPPDMPELKKITESRIQLLLPGLPPGIHDTLLARICRVPPREATISDDHAIHKRDRDKEVIHPADSAITGAVLVGTLLLILGRSPDTLGNDLAKSEKTHD